MVATPVPYDVLARVYAQSIWAKVGGLALDLTPSEEARLRESISDDIKKLSVSTPRQVSVRAAAKAEQMRIGSERLYGSTWHDQQRFDRGRKVFHLEHIRPVSSLRGLCLTSRSVSDVTSVLVRELRVAWILKSEDRALTRLGYRSNRPDPDQAYREAKIELLPHLQSP